MRMYDVLMLSKEWKKEVLIEFGFGMVSVKEVESWFRKKYPMDYKTLKTNLKWIKQQIKEGNKTLEDFERGFTRVTAENTTIQERNRLLDFVENNRGRFSETVK